MDTFKSKAMGVKKEALETIHKKVDEGAFNYSLSGVKPGRYVFKAGDKYLTAFATDVKELEDIPDGELVDLADLIISQKLMKGG